jgi:formamidopyrimidine-DNA glycosylase
MPELPEVETISRSLRPALVGRTILGAQLLWKRSLAVPSAGKFLSGVAGQTIQAVTRRAKFIHLRLTDASLIVHLRMSGDLALVPGKPAPGKHDRLLLVLSGEATLVFTDARKFGRVWLLPDPEDLFAGLGPEPLADDFTPDWLYCSLQARRRQLKPLLLDQGFLAGLGNIYTDEALHAARLHPLTSSEAVSPEQAGALWAAIRAVLAEGIRRNGASIDWVYRGGDFQNHFRVYGRVGEACPECGTTIVRLVIGQRGTHVCPQCQPLAEKSVKIRA